MAAYDNECYRFASTNVIATGNNLGFNLPGMEAGERIKAAREARGWSTYDLAKRIGISQPAIMKIEGGETRQSKFFPQIARALELDLSDLIPSLEAAPPGPEVIPEAALISDRDFPIYASAEGGPGEILRSSEAVDFMPRPAPVLHVKGAYGLLVTGDSMEPEYRNGDTAIINPHLPVVGGEVYIFYGEKHGEARATIKHLRRATADKWMVSQWNPPAGQERDFALARKDWAIVHRVLGKYSRR